MKHWANFARAFIACSFWFCMWPAHIQCQDTTVAMIRGDLPGFDSARLKSYLKNPEYQYVRYAPHSWLGDLWNAIKHWFRQLFSKSQSAGEQILKVFLILGALILLLYFFMQSRFQKLFSRSDQRYGDTVQILNEEVAVETLNDKIAGALRDHNYREAYRWTYIQLLHQLDQAGAIRLRGNKTNRDYVAEFSIPSLRNDFMSLANAFDYSWYGEYAIEGSSFESYRNLSANIMRQTSSK